MNKKVLTYLLLVLTLAVWALIVKRLFFSELEEIVSPVTTNVAKDVERVAVKRDMDLNLDYPDPFLKRTGRKKRTQRNSDRPPVQGPQTIKKQTNKDRSTSVRWPRIEYRGLIRNIQDDKSLGILMVDNRSHILSEGEQIKTLVIKSLDKDSIQIINGDEEQVFKRN